MKTFRTCAVGTLAACLVAVGLLLATPAVSQWAEITTNAIRQADTGRPITLDGGTTAGVQIGTLAGSYPIKGIYQLTLSITPGSQATITCAPQAFTVPGTQIGDVVWLRAYPATGNGTGYGASTVTVAGQINQTVCNPTAGALSPAAGTFIYLLLR